MFEFYKKLPAKQKLWAATCGVLLLGLFAYFFGFQKTVKLYQQYKAQQQMAVLAKNAPANIARYRKQLADIDKKLLEQNYSRQELFESVNTTCAALGLYLAGFGEENIEEHEGLAIATNPVEVRGPYKAIVQLAYELEQVQKITHIASLQFEKKRDVRKKEAFLSATFYLQNVLPKK
jgi:Tfp pilus assembly protein PilO